MFEMPKRRHAMLAPAIFFLLATAGGTHADTPVAAGAARGGHALHPKAYAAPRVTAARTKPMPGAAAALTLPYGGTPIDVLTYHYDNNRTGWNQAETDLSPASLALGGFGLLTTLPVDGNVFAQPLLVSNFVMPDGTAHDVLVIATGHNTIYAYDAQTYAILWQTNFGPGQSQADVDCDEVRPEYGITSTPVIVRSAANAATIYAVTATEPSYGQFQTQLHAVSLATGRDVRPAADIAPSAVLSDGSTLSFDPRNQWSRAGLAENNGSIYVGISSHCDNNWTNISGWMLRYGSKLKLTRAFHTIDTPHGGPELASVWMSGFAPAIGAAGNVFFTTGNGDFTPHGAKDWGDSVLSVGAALNGVSSFFTPFAYADINAHNQDFSSGGVMLLPAVAGQTAPPMAVTMGKAGTLYLLNQAKLGSLKRNDTGVLDSIVFGGRGLFGGPAYYNGLSGPTVFVQSDADVLRAFGVSVTGTPALTAGATGTTTAGDGGSLPVVSSNGAVPGTGLVWLIRRSEPMQLEAYDADLLGAPLYTATLGSWSNPDMENSFVTPMVANGRVYAPGAGSVSVFGLGVGTAAGSGSF